MATSDKGVSIEVDRDGLVVRPARGLARRYSHTSITAFDISGGLAVIESTGRAPVTLAGFDPGELAAVRDEFNSWRTP